MKKIMLVLGTRPEATKMCPLDNELKIRKNIQTIVCVTGQHREMLDTVLRTFGVEVQYNLCVMKKEQTLFDITTEILNKIQQVLDKETPDIVLVHGDTTTTFSTALACYYKRIRIGHVEAGLRTYCAQSPYPEEFNRQAVSVIADYHFAPTALAKENLLREGKREETVFVTGNTAIDALKTTVSKDFSHEILNWAENSRLILMTAHRRENLGEPMRRMFRAVRRIAKEYTDVKILYPIHKNPLVRSVAQEEFSDCENIRITEPLDVIECHNIMARSYLVLTDSGGIQEEAPSLGKPVLVMRDTTEREEGILAGTVKLVGTEEERVYENIKMLLEDEAVYRTMSETKNPYGDGWACKRIADVLEMQL